ncbi:unnamed protein product [Amoebophrya sp. A120]|nr:unnamed protein product [Amoebophrya sp. A120]|eukprot:GSA120T00004332001.1
MGKDEEVIKDLEHRQQLGGSSSVEHQAKFLKTFLRPADAEEDDAWDESFIASVTEEGRESVRDHLQHQIVKVLTDDESYHPNAEEVNQVRDSLQKMRESKRAVESLIEQHFRLLHSWFIDGKLLKETMIGKEVNDKFWTGNTAPGKIQKMAKSLVQRWLREHRAMPIHEINERRITHCAHDLEQNIYNCVHGAAEKRFGGSSRMNSHASKYSTDLVAKYRELTLRVRKYFTIPRRIGKKRLREIFDGDKTEREFVKDIADLPDSFFNAKHEFVGPGKVAKPLEYTTGGGSGMMLTNGDKPRLALANNSTTSSTATATKTKTVLGPGTGGPSSSTSAANKTKAKPPTRAAIEHARTTFKSNTLGDAINRAATTENTMQAGGSSSSSSSKTKALLGEGAKAPSGATTSGRDFFNRPGAPAATSSSSRGAGGFSSIQSAQLAQGPKGKLPQPPAEDSMSEKQRKREERNALAIIFGEDVEEEDDDEGEPPTKRLRAKTEEDIGLSGGPGPPSSAISDAAVDDLFAALDG